MTTPLALTTSRHRVFGPDWPADTPTDPSLLPMDVSKEIFTMTLLGAKREGQLVGNVLCMRAVCRAWFDEIKAYFRDHAPLMLSVEVGKHAFLCLVRRENPLDVVTSGKKCALWFRSLHFSYCNEEQAEALLRAPGWKRGELGTTGVERLGNIRFPDTAHSDQVLAGSIVLKSVQDVIVLARSLRQSRYGLELEIECAISNSAPLERLMPAMLKLMRAIVACPNRAMIKMQNLPRGAGGPLVKAFIGVAHLRLAESRDSDVRKSEADEQRYKGEWTVYEAQLETPRVAALWEEGRLQIRGRNSPAKWPPRIELVFPRETGGVVFNLQLSSSEQADLLLNYARCRAALGESAAKAVDLSGVNQIRSRPDARNLKQLFLTLQKAEFLHLVDLNLSRLNEKATAELVAALEKQQHLMECRLTKGRLRPYQTTQLASLVRGKGKQKALRELDLTNTVIEGGVGLAEAIADSQLSLLRITARRVSPAFMRALIAGLGKKWRLDRLDVGWIAPGQLLDLVAAAPYERFSGFGFKGRVISFRVPGDGTSVRVLSLTDPEFREIARKSVCHAYRISPRALKAFLADARNWSRFPSPSSDYADDALGYTTSLANDETRGREDSSDSVVSDDE